MPRYFFDLLGEREQIDRLGTPFPNEAAARQEALLRTLSDNSFRLNRYRGFSRISVRDEDGNALWEVRIYHDKNENGPH
jgi:hypothetical protein